MSVVAPDYMTGYNRVGAQIGAGVEAIGKAAGTIFQDIANKKNLEGVKEHIALEIHEQYGDKFTAKELNPLVRAIKESKTQEELAAKTENLTKSLNGYLALKDKYKDKDMPKVQMMDAFSLSHDKEAKDYLTRLETADKTWTEVGAKKQEETMNEIFNETVKDLSASGRPPNRDMVMAELQRRSPLTAANKTITDKVEKMFSITAKDEENIRLKDEANRIRKEIAETNQTTQKALTKFKFGQETEKERKQWLSDLYKERSKYDGLAQNMDNQFLGQEEKARFKETQAGIDSRINDLEIKYKIKDPDAAPGRTEAAAATQKPAASANQSAAEEFLKSQGIK